MRVVLVVYCLFVNCVIIMIVYTGISFIDFCMVQAKLKGLDVSKFGIVIVVLVDVHIIIVIFILVLFYVSLSLNVCCLFVVLFV